MLINKDASNLLDTGTMDSFTESMLNGLIITMQVPDYHKLRKEDKKPVKNIMVEDRSQDAPTGQVLVKTVRNDKNQVKVLFMRPSVEADDWALWREASKKEVQDLLLYVSNSIAGF